MASTETCIYCDKQIKSHRLQQHLRWHYNGASPTTFIRTDAGSDNDCHSSSVGVLSQKETMASTTQTDSCKFIWSPSKLNAPTTVRSSRRSHRMDSSNCHQALLSDAVWNQTFFIYKATAIQGLPLQNEPLRHYSQQLTAAFNDSLNKGLLNGNSLEKNEPMEAKIKMLKGREYDDIDIEGLAIQVVTAGSQETLLTAVLCYLGCKSDHQSVDPFKHYFPLVLIKSRLHMVDTLSKFLSDAFSCNLTPVKLTTAKLKIEFTYLLDWCQELTLGEEEKTVTLHYNYRKLVLKLPHLFELLNQSLDVRDPGLKWSEVKALFSHIEEPSKKIPLIATPELEAIKMPQVLLHRSGKIKILKPQFVPSILQDIQKLIF